MQRKIRSLVAIAFVLSATAVSAETATVVKSEDVTKSPTSATSTVPSPATTPEAVTLKPSDKPYKKIYDKELTVVSMKPPVAGQEHFKVELTDKDGTKYKHSRKYCSSHAQYSVGSKHTIEIQEFEGAKSQKIFSLQIKC